MHEHIVDWSLVHDAAAVHEDDDIEQEEHFRGRLMDGAQNSRIGLSNFPKRFD